MLSYRHVRSALRKYKWVLEFDVQVTVVVGRLGVLVTLWSCHEVHYSLTQNFSQFNTEAASSGVFVFFPACL